MTKTEGIFDFLRGDRTIPVSTAETEQEENLKDFENETWTLYTLNPESNGCPLDCLIIAVQENCILSSSLNESVRKKIIVKCTSCSPNGVLPILVAESNGHVLETAEIIEKFFKIGNISLYAAIDGLLGGYIRVLSSKKYINTLPNTADVIELVEALPSASLDPSVTVLLYSMVEGVKMHLKASDPVRIKIERCEFLNELFINLLESNNKL